MAPSSRRRRKPTDAAQTAEEGKAQPSDIGDSSISRPKKSSHHARRRRRGGRTRDEGRDDAGEDSFCALALKVGVVIAIVASVLRTVALTFWGDGQYDDLRVGGRDNDDVAIGDTNAEELPNILPSFSIEDESDVARARIRHNSDAFGIARTLLGDDNEVDKVGIRRSGEDDRFARFVEAARGVREEFASRYGGEDAARWILRRAITTFDSDRPHENVVNGNGRFIDDNLSSNRWRGVAKSVRIMADRILSARSANRALKVAFGGYSVTAGRGNHHSQSFPYVLERILSEPMKLLGVDLVVRNAAIGGVPSFPYGWCLPNFLGDDADVVSWDYSMNEAGDVTEGIEAYLRHALQLRNKPMVIVKDTQMAVHRRELLQRYADLGLTADALVLHSDPATAPFLSLSESRRPSGFQNWREFGSPVNAPGRAPHHPAAAEHELLGWVLSMHFLGAAEVAAAATWRAKGDIAEGKDQEVISSVQASTGERKYMLPPPLFSNSGEKAKGMHSLSESIEHLLYGYRAANAAGEEGETWEMRNIHCRTSFDPIVSGPLEELIIYGTVSPVKNGKNFLGDIMFPKGRGVYNKGWVVDLGEAEKKAKRRLQRYDLGFVDSKKALYGIKASGQLGLFIPIERENIILSQSRGGQQGVGHDEVTPKEGDDATLWFQSIVVCEVNEKRGEGECDLEKDLSFVVGGTRVHSMTRIHAEGVSYLGKDICIILDIPSDSRVERRGNVLERAESSGIDIRMVKTEEKHEQMGIALEIHITRASIDPKKACSVSHVVWQQVPLQG